MTPLDFFLSVAAACLIILTAVLVPALLQIKRSARKVEVLLDSVNQDIPPLIQSLSDTSREVQALLETIKDKVDRTEQVLSTAKATADTIYIITSMMKKSVTPIIAQIGGVTAGILAFFRYITKSDQRH